MKYKILCMLLSYQRLYFRIQILGFEKTHTSVNTLNTLIGLFPGEDRGPVLEVIVSRTNFISSHTSKTVRVVGLSTALANARDLADWLGIGQVSYPSWHQNTQQYKSFTVLIRTWLKSFCPCIPLAF